MYIKYDTDKDQYFVYKGSKKLFKILNVLGKVLYRPVQNDWKVTYSNNFVIFHCPNCGVRFDTDLNKCENITPYDFFYCPVCGHKNK